MAKPNHFVKDSYITKRAYSIYKTLSDKHTSVREVAKTLGISESTIYVTRRKVHQIVERAFRTLEVALELSVLDVERCEELVKRYKDLDTSVAAR